MSATVFYDEDCGVCRYTADKLVRYGRPALRAIPIQGAEAQAALDEAGIPVARRMESWHFLGPDGRLTSAGAAVGPLARTLRFGRPFGALADAFPGLTDRVYRWLAAHREQVGSLLGQNACSIDPSMSHPRGDQGATPPGAPVTFSALA